MSNLFIIYVFVCYLNRNGSTQDCSRQRVPRELEGFRGCPSAIRQDQAIGRAIGVAKHQAQATTSRKFWWIPLLFVFKSIILWVFSLSISFLVLWARPSLARSRLEVPRRRRDPREEAKGQVERLLQPKEARACKFCFVSIIIHII